MSFEDTKNTERYNLNMDTESGDVLQTTINDEGAFEVSDKSRETFVATIKKSMRGYFVSTVTDFAKECGVELTFTEVDDDLSYIYTLHAIGQPQSVAKFHGLIKDFGR